MDRVGRSEDRAQVLHQQGAEEDAVGAPGVEEDAHQQQVLDNDAAAAPGTRLAPCRR